MNILVESSKPFDRAVADLRRSVADNGFSVLHIHALSDTLASKGQPIDKQVSVLEVCGARIASQLLCLDPMVSLALPCRIAVFEHEGRTRMGSIAPTSMLAGFDLDPAVDRGAKDVERTLRQILADAA